MRKDQNVDADDPHRLRDRRRLHTRAQKRSDIFSIIGTLTGCVALIVSIWSAVLSNKSSKDSTGSQLIAETYSTFYDLNKKQAEDAKLSHMFVAADDYRGTAMLVQQSVGALTKEQKAEYLLKEKAISFYIFTAFEETFYQYNHAVEVRDVKRSEFLKAVLDYFTGRLLRNPRLLYYWSAAGGNVSQYYELETREYYKLHVLTDPSAPLEFAPDSTGPYVVKNSDDLKGAVLGRVESR